MANEALTRQILIGQFRSAAGQLENPNETEFELEIGDKIITIYLDTTKGDGDDVTEIIY